MWRVMIYISFSDDSSTTMKPNRLRWTLLLAYTSLFFFPGVNASLSFCTNNPLPPIQIPSNCIQSAKVKMDSYPTGSSITRSSLVKVGYPADIHQEAQPDQDMPDLLVFKSETNQNHQSRVIVKCPLGCDCRVGSVYCTSDIWDTIPKLPQSTKYVTMIKSKIIKLESDLFQTNHGENLQLISIRKCGLEEVDQYAFRGLSNLLQLTLTKTKLHFLSPDAFQGLTKVWFLNLRHNHITSISNIGICHLVSLQVLDLSYNNISTLNISQCFSKLKFLKSLHLAKNKNINLQNDTFDYLKNTSLETLDLYRCHLSTIPSRMFQSWRSLKSLNLGANNLHAIFPETYLDISHITSLTLSDAKILQLNHIWNLSSLEYLVLNGINISHLNSSMLHNMSNLSYLSLQRAGIESIKSGTFASLGNLSSLQLQNNALLFRKNSTILDSFKSSKNLSVNLSRVKIKKLSNDIFGHLEDGNNITCLSLKHSWITKVQKNAFEKLPNLNILDLQSNYINRFHRHTFNNLKNLTILNLYQNSLPMVPNAKFLGLSNLQVLLLGSNNIHALYTNSFDGYNKLIHLDLGFNPIVNLDKRAFSKLTSLVTLDLKGGREKKLPSGLFQNLNNLKVLKIGKFSYIRESMSIFHGLKSINNLIIDDMYLQKNVQMKINTMPTLKCLQLTRCRIKYLPEFMFQNLFNLTHLNLSRNYIQSWKKEVFKPLKNLVSLDLSINSITSLDPDAFIYLLNLKELDLSGNIMSCDCDFIGIHEWLFSGDVYLQNFIGQNYKCSDQRLQIQYKPHVAACFVYRERASLIALTLFWAICIPILIIVRCRWNLRYVFMVKLQGTYNKPRCQVVKDHLFDIYIAYARPDLKWIIEKFLPYVEKELGYRMCLHDRNWKVGADIADCIDQSIQSSCKVILLLSDHFAHSEWCQYQLMLAEFKLQGARKGDLIPVLLSDIKSKNLTARLKCLLESKTYIPWPQDNEEGQVYFWKILMKKMCKRRNHLAADPLKFHTLISYRKR